jgi:CheY-like chemotaxis protein
VEDDAGDAELVQIWLRRAAQTHYELWHVETLGDAEACLARAEFDLALVDVTLPDASGPWPFHALHDRHPEVPIIVLTTFDQAEVGEKLLDEGAYDHLVKGQMSGDTLTRSMRHVIERGRLARELRRRGEEAEAAPRARAELLAELTHEVRTPLHTVLGMADLLLETELTREQEGYVRSFLRASESLLARLDALLGAPEREAGAGPAAAGETGVFRGAPLRPGAVEALPLRILLVDDDPEGRERTLALLSEGPHVVEVAGDGRVAVEMFAADEFDLVLMDVHLPGMDGLEATRAIRRVEDESGSSPTPILALTAGAEPDEVKACLAAGCDTHLAKPVHKTMLLDALARHAPKHRSRLLRVHGAMADRIDRYLHDRHNDLAGLRLALDADDLESARVVAEDLAASAASHGFSELADIGRSLGEAARAGDREALARGITDLTGFLREVKLVVD